MIDEKKLIESLKDSYGLWGLVGIDEVVKIIKSQPQIEKCGDCSRRKFYQQGYEAGKNENKWISCSERLPETEGEYLTCDKKGNIHMLYHFHSNKNPFAIGENHTRYYPVIAWMPLPESYRE